MQQESSSEEIVHGHDEYTAEELLEQCQDNAASLLLATMSVLDARGVTVEEWAAGVARVFARTWDREDVWQAAPFLDALLTNLRALGARVEDADLEADNPHATISHYPNVALAEALAVDAAYAEGMLHVGAHLARLLDLDLAWHRAGEAVVVRVRAPAEER